MKIANTLPTLGTILLIIIAFASCQEDISTIGSEVLGAETPNGILDDSKTVISYSRKLLPVQSNRLPVYQLGVYNDPIYGKSTISLLSQLTLERNNPTFGDSAVLDSVTLYIPFFSEATTGEETTYTLDSIFGNSPINISLFQSDYFLRDLDPDTGFEEFQKYYSNQGPTFESFLGPLIHTIENFTPDNEGFVFTTGEGDEEVETLLAPGLRVNLPVDYFTERILEMEGDPVLDNNNNFRNYFRGIYFKVESSTDDGSLFLFDIAGANITLHYSFDGDDGRENEILALNFGGVNVNTFENEIPANIEEAITNPNILNGNENLYVRGGEGVISVIELFGKDENANGVADELDELRDKKWLINEANLIFYVNQDLTPGGATEPERLIIYDLKNSNILVDFSLDITGGLEPIDAVSEHLGRLERGNDENGDFYKIKITNHVSNLINKDSTNVALGLIVSQNVLNNTTQELESPQAPGIKEVPSSSVVSPEGTVLYGNNTSNLEKRLKLQIYYTEPN